jgi:hypothetical protein
VRRSSDISLQEFVKSHEVASAKRHIEEKRKSQNINPAQLSSLPKVHFNLISTKDHFWSSFVTSTDILKQEASRPTSSHRPNLPQKDTEPCIKHSSNSGLPKGWKANHDRFIAYLDTHAPLARDGTIAFREWKKPRYTVEQMICLLKERFVRFRTVVSHPSRHLLPKLRQ